MVLFDSFRLIFRVIGRFRGERLAQTAGALSFATLMALVPMIGVAAALIHQLPIDLGVGSALEKFLLANLLPDKAGQVIAKYVGQFAGRAGRMTYVGIAALAATAVMQMLTIEHAFNVIWKVKSPRPLVKRILIHALALAIGPLAFGGSLAATTYLAGVSLGLVAEPPWVTALVSGVLPLSFLIGILALLYWAVPRRPVVFGHALIGGGLAAAAFSGMHYLFGRYVIDFPTYTVVYGPFAAIPIFLAWLYLSWTVILIGALVTAELPGAGK